MRLSLLASGGRGGRPVGHDGDRRQSGVVKKGAVWQGCKVAGWDGQLPSSMGERLPAQSQINENQYQLKSASKRFRVRLHLG